jgi:SAM-dependent methyltransferase
MGGHVIHAAMTSVTNFARITPCPICATGQMRFAYAKNGHDIRSCDFCGIGRATVRDFDPTRYYTRAYFEGGHDDGYANYGRSEAVLRKEFARITAKLRAVAPQGGPLLEIGCAYGFFLQAARLHWQVYGLEISAEAVEHCHAAGLITVRHGMANRESLSALSAFQAIVMLDVIEHLSDPIGLLEACREKLLPGGVLMLTTGDFGSPLARFLGSRWRLMTPPQHLWFFTIPGFRALAQRQGWEVVRVSHPGKRVPLSLILFQIRRMLGLAPRVSASGAGIGIPVNLGDAMLLILRRPIEKAS